MLQSVHETLVAFTGSFHFHDLCSTMWLSAGVEDPLLASPAPPNRNNDDDDDVEQFVDNEDDGRLTNGGAGGGRTTEENGWAAEENSGAMGPAGEDVLEVS